MPDLLIQLTQIAVDLVIFLFVGFYLFDLRAKEKELEKKESKINADYSQIINEALAKERKILEDGTNQASQMITGAQYINQFSKETMNQALQKIVLDIQSETFNSSKDFMKSYSEAIKQLTNQSLNNFQIVAKEIEIDIQKQQKMVLDIQAEAFDTGRNFMNSYSATLKQISTQSLNEFQYVAKLLQLDLQKQIKEFHDTLIPTIEKELEEYKQSRLKQAEETITRIIQSVSQQILNKSITLDDQQHLMIESLEKAKKEGVLY